MIVNGTNSAIQAKIEEIKKSGEEQVRVEQNTSKSPEQTDENSLCSYSFDDNDTEIKEKELKWYQKLFSPKNWFNKYYISEDGTEIKLKRSDKDAQVYMDSQSGKLVIKNAEAKSIKSENDEEIVLVNSSTNKFETGDFKKEYESYTEILEENNSKEITPKAIGENNADAATSESKDTVKSVKERLIEKYPELKAEINLYSGEKFTSELDRLCALENPNEKEVAKRDYLLALTADDMIENFDKTSEELGFSLYDKIEEVCESDLTKGNKYGNPLPDDYSTIEPEMLAAIITNESSGMLGQKSDKGALGLCGIMPVAREDINTYYSGNIAKNNGGKNLDENNVEDNILLGAMCYKRNKGALEFYTDKDDMDPKLILAAYNAGCDKVIDANYQVPDIAETKAYVNRVYAMYEFLKSHPEYIEEFKKSN